MTAGYTENPLNFGEIEPYVITEKAEIVMRLLKSRKCFFYDACGLRKHVHMTDPDIFFRYILREQGVLVLTRCILMELASRSGVLNPEYVDFIRKIHDAGIPILVIYEEDLFMVMDACFSQNQRINDFLSFAVRTVKTPTGTVTDTLKADSCLCAELFPNPVPSSNLYQHFFETVRRNKEQGDNLGEELIIICFHILSNLPQQSEYRYILLTEDKGAIGLLCKAKRNADVYGQRNSFSAVTTMTIVQRICEYGMVTAEPQLLQLLQEMNPSGTVKLMAAEEYDLEAEEKTMGIPELCRKLLTPGKIHIYY